MSSSSIFAVIAAVIIVVGRIINRVATAKGNDTDDTTRSFDAAHEFDGEEAIPARKIEIPKSEEALAGTILAQILEERRKEQVPQQGIPQVYTKRIQPQKFVSSYTSTPPKPKRAPKPKTNTPQIKAKNIIVEPQMEGPSIAEEFDLKKAVIFSEILKPKFDE
ncbi:MAG: hypothetical protein IJX68_02630 [Rikenellaceae bacterium]|nr:hypothetical protein [Rikenellaceae bacterium]